MARLGLCRTSPAQKLDIYLPETGDGPFPVLFYMHGGGFRMGDKRDIYLASYLARIGSGLRVGERQLPLERRSHLSGAASGREGGAPLAAGERPQYRLDTERVAAGGQSSGGNFAAMMCTTAGVEMFEDPDAWATPSSRLRCRRVSTGTDPLISWPWTSNWLPAVTGRCDHGEPDSPESKYLGAPIAEVPDKVAQANPMTWVNADMAPLLIQHGRDDVRCAGAAVHGVRAGHQGEGWARPL